MNRPDVIALSGTNIALLGSDEEVKKRVEIAKTQKTWEGCGQKEGIEEWRIEGFEAKRWTGEKGTFYDGDAYIVLHTHGDEKHKNFYYDIHFWIGKNAGIDKQGVVAYKVIELDAFLGTHTTHYRELQGNESKKFHDYFDHMSVLHGGTESAFHHHTSEEYKPKLLHVKGRAEKMRVHEIPLHASEMNNGDCYVLDCGNAIYIYEGKESNPSEKLKAGKIALGIESMRNGHAKVHNLSDVDNAPFWKAVAGSVSDIKSSTEGGSDLQKTFTVNHDAVVYVLSDSSGNLVLNKVQTGAGFNRAVLNSDDVFIVDDGDLTIYVWVGKNSSKGEKHNCMLYAQDYAAQVMKHDAAIIRLSDGNTKNEPQGFSKLFAK